MVEVYIWLPTKGFEYISRFQTGDYNLSYEERSKKASMRDFHRGVGHASLFIDFDGKYESEYVSFWPNDGHKKDLEAYLANLVRPFDAVIHSYNDDLFELGREPDYAIRLENLDEDNIHLFMVNSGFRVSPPQNFWKTYNIWGTNCSTVTLHLLHYGTHNLNPGFTGNAKLFAKRAFEALKAAAQVGAFLVTSYEQHKNYASHYYPDFALQHFDPAKTVFSVVEMFGLTTPEAVLEYCKFLNNEVG